MNNLPPRRSSSGHWGRGAGRPTQLLALRAWNNPHSGTPKKIPGPHHQTSQPAIRSEAGSSNCYRELPPQTARDIIPFPTPKSPPRDLPERTNERPGFQVLALFSRTRHQHGDDSGGSGCQRWELERCLQGTYALLLPPLVEKPPPRDGRLLTRQQDKEKPVAVRSSNIVAARGVHAKLTRSTVHVQSG